MAIVPSQPSSSCLISFFGATSRYDASISSRTSPQSTSSRGEVQPQPAERAQVRGEEEAVVLLAAPAIAVVDLDQDRVGNWMSALGALVLGGLTAVATLMATVDAPLA